MVEAQGQPLPGYDGVAKTLHWLIVALLIGQFAVAWTMPDINPRTVPGTLVNLHFAIGVTVLALAILRLLWRFGHPVPLIRDNIPAWQNAVAVITHWLFYLLLFLLPILGWMDANFRGYAVDYFGLVTIPRILAATPALAGSTGDLHTLVSYILLGVAGLHAAAALYHHVWLRDRVLTRMLPGAR